MGEVIRLHPLFPGKKDNLDQLTKIFEVIGTPDSTMLGQTCAPGL